MASPMFRAALVSGAVLWLMPVGVSMARDAGERGHVIARSPEATKVSALGGTVVWSEYRAKSRRFRLVQRRGGRTRVLPIRSRRVPFDVDLGRDGRGRLVAVYSRCRREGEGSDASWRLPTYTAGAGCDIHRYDFASRRETRIRGASTRASSETLPSFWGNRLAFAARRDTVTQLPGKPARVYTLRLRGTRARRLVAAGTPPNPKLAPGGGPGPISLDLRGRRLVIAWHVEVACEPGDVDEVTQTEGPTSELITADVTSGRSKIVARGCSTADVSRYLTPTWDDEGTIWFTAMVAERGLDGPARVLGSFNGRSFAYGDVDLSSSSASVAGCGRIVYARDVPRHPTEVRLLRTRTCSDGDQRQAR